MKAFRFDHAGIQRIHADPARSEFSRASELVMASTAAFVAE
jgi:hypothetical protein